MSNVAVIGLGFGDEGKGLVTDYLCSKLSNPLVVRFSGGHQAAHNVVFKDTQHIFSNFGSGTLRWIPTYWSPQCTIDPIGILNELKILKDKNINPKLFIDAECPVTTPYDKCANQIQFTKNNHGSVGVGFGTTIQREKDFYSLKFIDLFYPQVFKEKLKMIINYYDFSTPQDEIDIITREFKMVCKELIRTKGIEMVPYRSSMNFDNYIYEGSQGLMLDPKIGFFPHVTRSNIMINTLKNNDYIRQYYMVTRAYCTRHGNGPFPNEGKSDHIKDNPDETNVYNEYQGNFKKIILDVSLLEYAIRRTSLKRYNSKNTLVITCMDHLSEYLFLYSGQVCKADSKEDMAIKIASLLNIDHVLISTGCTADDIKEIN